MRTFSELAAEARAALAAHKETPKEHFERLIRMGLINRRGEITKLYGGDAEPEGSCDAAED